MSYGKRFWEIIERLQAIRAEEQALGRELTEEVNRHETPATAALLAAVTGSTPGKGEGRSRKSKKGELTALVTSLLKGYTRPAKLDTIAKRVQAQRPGTTQASVATALHALVRKNVVVKPEPSTFQLLKTPAAPAPAKAPRGLRKAAESQDVPASQPAPRAEPAVVREEEGVLIES